MKKIKKQWPVFILGILVGAGIFRSGISAQNAPIPEEIKAKRLVIVDQKGNPHIVLTTADDGNTSIVGILDKDQKPALVLGVNNEGERYLDVSNKEGQRMLVLAIHAKGDSSFQMINPDGKAQLTLSLQKQTLPGLGLFTSEGKPKAALLVGKDENAALVFWDKEGKPDIQSSIVAGIPKSTLPSIPLPSLLNENSSRRSPGIIGGTHWVKEITRGGEFVILEDGSVWEISLLDRLDSSLWLAMDDIIIVPNSSNFLYPYKLINKDQGETVEAKRISP